MPKLGESIIEATITKWLKNPGDTIEEDDPIVEIATDKVDSEIPSPVEGRLIEALYQEGDIVPVGKIIAIIETDPNASVEPAVGSSAKTVENVAREIEESIPVASTEVIENSSDRFYSPLVKNIAKTEGITQSELDQVPGTGKDGRVSKDDLMAYLKTRGQSKSVAAAVPAQPAAVSAPAPAPVAAQSAPVKHQSPAVISSAGDEIVEMDRMRKLIADHMVMSVQTSPHVTSFIEVDVTNIVKWRDRVKDDFQKREKEKITFTPIFVEAAAQALKDFPGVNASVDGYKVILRKNINIGMAAALPNGNLIVPVIKNADQKNLLGLAKDVNSLANKARTNKLDPDDISGGTFTITNLGTFGSITGSPIINQPQVAILGVGVIKKKPVVIETEEGDVIAIRHMMILSLSYDHRVVDGALGGMYLQRMQQLLESFDPKRII